MHIIRTCPIRELLPFWGVSVEELEKVKESSVTKNTIQTSYSSPQSAPLDEILNVSGSGVLLACVLSDGTKDDSEHGVLKIDIDGETIFYRSITSTPSASSSNSATVGLAYRDALYFRWSSNVGSSYLPYDYGGGVGNDTYFRKISNRFNTIDKLKSFEEVATVNGVLETLEAPVRFENSLKVSATYYHGSDRDIKQYLIRTRYILD